MNLRESYNGKFQGRSVCKQGHRGYSPRELHMADMGGADYMSNTRKTVSVGASHITTTTTTTSLLLALNIQISHHLQIARLIGAGGVWTA